MEASNVVGGERGAEGRRLGWRRPRPSPGMPAIVDAQTLVKDAISAQGVDLAQLVAATALWAPPPVPLVPIYQQRRARTGEKRREVVDGIKLDDNTLANKALKRAIAPGVKFEGFAVSHIWPETCYDVRYHTLLANLVLLPRALAGLSDHDQHVQRCLQYRAFELYDWYPRERDSGGGEQPGPPIEPEGYPANWNLPGYR